MHRFCFQCEQKCRILPARYRVEISHVEDLRYLRVVEEVLLLVVLLQLSRVIVPAFLCRVHPGMGVVLGLQREPHEGKDRSEGDSLGDKLKSPKLSLPGSDTAVETSGFYFLDIQLGGVEVMLRFLCLLCGLFSFCPLLGKALLNLPDTNNQHRINKKAATVILPLMEAKQMYTLYFCWRGSTWS